MNLSWIIGYLRVISTFLLLSFSSAIFAFTADEIREQYEKVFDEKMRARIEGIDGSFEPYQKEIEKDSFDGLRFHLKAIRMHNLLKQKNDIFGVKNIKPPSFRKNICEAERTLRAHYLDLLQVYWLGFIAFLDDLDQKKGEFDKFVKHFEGRLPVGPNNDKFFLNGTVSFNRYGARLTKNNQGEFLRSLIVIYALEVFSYHGSEVSTSMRIKAIKMWRSVDPDGKLLISKLLDGYGARYSNDLESYLLPRSFALGDLGTPRDISFFVENKYLEGVFGDCFFYREPDDFARGLNIFLERHRQEVSQIIHSILRLPIKDSFKLITVKKLFELVDCDEGAVELIFGHNASYRNRGEVTLVLDDISYLSRDDLADLARSQRKQLKENEEKIDLQSRQIAVMKKRILDMKNALARERANNNLD